MTRSTPASAAAWNTLAKASRLGAISSSQGADSSPLAARWTTVSTPWKCVIQSSSRIARLATMTSESSVVGGFVDQNQVIDVGPGGTQLAADVAARARDQDGPWLLFDQPGKQLVLEFFIILIIIIVIIIVIITLVIVIFVVEVQIVDVVITIDRARLLVRIVDWSLRADRPPGFLALVVGIVVVRGMIGTHD